MRRILVVTSMTLLIASCSEELTQEDTAPRVTAIGPLEQADSRTVFVNYSITDLEGDDASLEALVCRGNDCSPAVQGVGGDGLARVPTLPAQKGAESASRVFAWDVACGSVDLESGAFQPMTLDDEVTVALRVLKSDREPVATAVFSLTEIGFDSGDPSGMMPPCQEE